MRGEEIINDRCGFSLKEEESRIVVYCWASLIKEMLAFDRLQIYRLKRVWNIPNLYYANENPPSSTIRKLMRAK